MLSLSPDLEGRVSKFQNPASLFCLRIFLKIFDLVTFDHVIVLTLRWHVLRVCTYKSNKMYEWGYGTRFQACSHKERIGTEIPKLLKYFNNFESNCYIKYLFNFRTGATFNFFCSFFSRNSIVISSIYRES